MAEVLESAAAAPVAAATFINVRRVMVIPIFLLLFSLVASIKTTAAMVLH